MAFTKIEPVGLNAGINTTFVSAVGIQSASSQVGVGITQLNFVGTGNTFAVNGTTVDISIAGGGGAAGAGTVINYPNGTASPFILSLARVTQSIDLDDTVAAEDSNIVVGESTFVVDDGATVTVGEGKKVIADLYDVVGDD
tara:strand:- start:4289 stop:4711 length:423 start_codon:yes stop_codon:yes gene_type:complete